MTATPGQKASVKQEKKWAEKVGGIRNPGSGNGWRHKNDVREDDFSHELKFTSKSQFTLKLADLLTAEKNALVDGKEMTFVIEMGGRNWVIVADYTFHELRGN